MSLLNIIGSLTQALPYIKAQKEGKKLGPQNQTAANMANVSDALYNTSNPLYQNIYKSNVDAGRQDLAATIAELSNQNRKLVSMGRTPLLNQERGGESVFRNLIKGSEDVGNQARTGTLDQLKAAQAALGGTYTAQNAAADSNYQNKLLRANAYYGLGGLARTYDPTTNSFGGGDFQIAPPQSDSSNLLDAIRKLLQNG